VGIYYRKFRKTGRKIWWLSFTSAGRQVFESSHSTSKRFAEKLLAIRQAEVATGRYEMLKKSPPLGEWSEKYLKSVQNNNTRRRYACSSVALNLFFGENELLNNITAARINEFTGARREGKLKAASINRDLRYLAQLLKHAERQRCLSRSPFDLGKFFQNEAKDRRKPHILSWEEQEQLLAVAPPRIRVLTVLGTETGMRSGEMLNLRWVDLDFIQEIIQVMKSKTQSGIRAVPMSAFCKSELLRWRNLIGPEHSEWCFPSYDNKRHKLQGGRKAWASTLRKAGLPYRPQYYLRHTFASRMTATGVSPLTIASLLGHSSSQIIPRYAQVLDQNRIDAMKKLELLRQSSVPTEFKLESRSSNTESTIRQ
jgi:integrase